MRKRGDEFPMVEQFLVAMLMREESAGGKEASSGDSVSEEGRLRQDARLRL